MMNELNELNEFVNELVGELHAFLKMSTLLFQSTISSESPDSITIRLLFRKS